MAILVTRPHPDGEATAAALRAKGRAVLLAPMLRFEAVAFDDDEDVRYDGIVVTSANALRGIEDHPAKDKLIGLPLFAVGDHTAETARRSGFRKVVAADGGAEKLRALVVKSVGAKRLRKAGTLLYLAGADLARDLAGELGAQGFTVVTQTTYRMIPVPNLPREVCDAFASDAIDAVLHYSRRSARAFVDAARAAGIEISALALPQLCISDAVAAIVRDAGGTQVTVARSPDETALFDILDRAFPGVSR